MAFDLTSTTFPVTYRDDFKDSDNFHRILFNSGRALQARELTQMQTIIQREMERFGANIFKDGAAVNPVQNISITNTPSVKLNTSVNSLPADPSTLVGTTFTGATSGVQAVVREVIVAEGSDPATLFVDYVDTQAAISSEETITFESNEDINNGSVTLTVAASATNPNGLNTVARIDAGVFFVRGHFVYTEAQQVIVDKYTDDPTANIGFTISETVVTADDDPALYDNQGVTPNVTAPGADRYRIRLTLTTQDQVDSDQDFVFVAAIVLGEVSETNDGRGDYNLILDVMAQRRFEESGNYTVRPFFISFSEDSAGGTQYSLAVQSGVGYVNGYRVAPQNTVLKVDKPQDTIEISEAVSAASFGNYVSTDSNQGSFNTDDFELVTLKDDSSFGGSSIGTARVRAVEPVSGGNYRHYLFDIRLDSTSGFSSLKSFGVDSSNYASLIGTQTSPTDNVNNNMLFTLPYRRPAFGAGVSLVLDYIVYEHFVETASAFEATITTTKGNFTSSSSWIITTQGGTPVTPDSITGIGTSTATIDITSTGLTATETLIVHALVQRQNVPYKTKTLINDATQTSPLRTSASGEQYIDLRKADIFNVTAAWDADSNDVLPQFTVDNGQRDNWYAPGRLVLNSGATAPASDVTVKFDYFTHSTAGGYFAAKSYDGAVAYGDIPSITLRNGQVVELREVLDFRPRLDDNANDDSAGVNYFTQPTARLCDVPVNTTLLEGDMTFYLPRRDTLVVDQTGELIYILGTSSLTPTLPQVPPTAMALYDVDWQPNAVSTSEIRPQYIENKRYTMRDIGRLERQIEINTELATLGLLEVETATLEVLDEQGINRTKSGFFVDNFRDNVPQDIKSTEYMASNDIERGELRPAFAEKHVHLVQDSAAGVNIKRVSDAIMLDYDDELYIEQPLASDPVNVNPFNITNNIGEITLTPNQDNWFDQREEQEVVPPAIEVLGSRTTTAGGVTTNPAEFITLWERIDPNWRSWDWGWWGRSGQNLSDGVNRFLDINDISYTASTITGVGGRSISRSEFNRSLSQISIQQSQQSGRTVRTVSIPFMRSREVSFVARGLRPNTQHFAFFDGVDVSNWVRQLTAGASTALIDQINSDPESVVVNGDGRTQHPDGSSTLISDATGTLRGSFFVPNSRTGLRFRAGTRSFALFDVTEPNPTRARSQASTDFESSGDTRITTTTSSAGITIGGVLVSRPDAPSTGKATKASRTRTRVIDLRTDRTVTRVTRTTRRDPLAQTFFNAATHPVFVTKVGVFLQRVGSTAQRDLICELRPVVNGYPSATERLQYGSAAIPHADLLGQESSTAATETIFTFPRPVALDAETEYAIVLLSQSDDYEVWVGTVGNFVVGSTEQRITTQPSTGSLFKSQNGATWEPSQLQDLKFNLYVADFTKSTFEGSASFVLNDLPKKRLPDQPLITTAGSSTVRVVHPFHGMFAGDVVNLSLWDSALDSSSTAGGLATSTISGNRTIIAADATGYTFAADSVATASSRSGGLGWQATENAMVDVAYLAVDHFAPDFTTIDGSFKLVSGKSFAGNETPYDADTAFTAFDVLNNTELRATKLLLNSLTRTSSGNYRGVNIAKPVEVNLAMRTNNKYVSPVINYHNASFHAIANVIDNQDSADAQFNTPIQYIAETNSTGGTAIAKYVSKTVTLEIASVGLSIIVSANRPSQTDFDVYYKTVPVGSEQSINERPWVQVEADTINPIDDDGTTFRDYRYTPGGLTGTLTPFNQFKIKIVMRSSNQIKYPRFKDLRAIALTV